jgi:transcriptional regulator with XRE-family HTH domain
MKTHLPPLPQSIGAVGERIVQLRKERGYTQKELAEKIGIERPLLTDYEIGRLRLGDAILARLAIALGVSADHLLGLSEADAVGYNPDLKITKTPATHPRAATGTKAGVAQNHRHLSGCRENKAATGTRFRARREPSCRG